MNNVKNNNNVSVAEKPTNETLFKTQKHTLDLFLERKAISKEEYDKSLNKLKTKMKV